MIGMNPQSWYRSCRIYYVGECIGTIVQCRSLMEWNNNHILIPGIGGIGSISWWRHRGRLVAGGSHGTILREEAMRKNHLGLGSMRTIVIHQS